MKIVEIVCTAFFSKVFNKKKGGAHTQYIFHFSLCHGVSLDPICNIFKHSGSWEKKNHYQFRPKPKIMYNFHADSIARLLD